MIDAAAAAAAQAELAAQLVIAQEQANRAVADNETLKKQAADLERQLAETTVQLNDQSAQMQAMKTELDAVVAAKQATASAPPVAPVEPQPEPVAPPPAIVEPPAPVAATQPAVEPVVEPQPAVEPVVEPQPASQPVVEPPSPPSVAPASKPAAQTEEGSLGTMLATVMAVLLIAVGLWFVRKRQQSDKFEQGSPAAEAQAADTEMDQMMAQYGAEHPIPTQESVAPSVEEKTLTTDEALDRLLADADLGVTEASEEVAAAVQHEVEVEAPVMEALADDDLVLSDDLMPTTELEDWSVDALSADTAPTVDKDFVFEPELFVDEVTASPVVAEVPAAAQPEPAVDESFHDATDRDFVVTKLELARQYLEMSDAESARDLLQEVLEEGDEELKQAAMDLLKKIS
ncbi:MAG: FimV/HubP family polar landmark protein [Pseudomonadales bacterium]